MSRVRAVGWLAALLSAALVAEPMRASVRDFVAEITLELPDESAVALGSAAGRATVSSSDELLFPPSALSGPTAATFTPPGSLCVSTISLVPSGFRGGVLGPSAENGFGGAIGIDGNVVLEVLAGAVPSLPAA